MPILLVTEREASDAIKIRRLLARAGCSCEVRVVSAATIERLSAPPKSATPSKTQTKRPGCIRVGRVTIDPASFTLLCDGRSVFLPRKEFMVLYKLASEVGRVFTREQLLDFVWGDSPGVSDHTLDVHINRLRRQLDGMGGLEVVAMRDGGYRLDVH